jgi:hypothetical protein
MLPERSIASRYARSVFFEEVNDLDVYIEDTAKGYEKIFVEILSRALQGRYRVAKVFPLGSRKTVISHCSSPIDKGARPYLYIVDGDLFLLCGGDSLQVPGLFSLPVYCIENLLIDGGALHDLLNEEHPTKYRDELVQEFDFEGWRKTSELQLFNLFVEYAISFLANPQQQTVSYSVSRLVSSNDGYLDGDKVAQRIASIKGETLRTITEEQYLGLRKKIVDETVERGVDKLHYVSGKDYLLPLLKMRFRTLAQSKISDINLKIRLATRCSIDLIANLHNAVCHQRPEVEGAA